MSLEPKVLTAQVYQPVCSVLERESSRALFHMTGKHVPNTKDLNQPRFANIPAALLSCSRPGLQELWANELRQCNRPESPLVFLKSHIKHLTFRTTPVGLTFTNVLRGRLCLRSASAGFYRIGFYFLTLIAVRS